MRLASRRALIWAAALGLALSTPASAEELRDLASALGRVRSEVEGLSEEIRDVEERKRQRLRSLSTQETDLEVELGRQRLRLQQLRERKAKLQEETAARARASQAQAPAARAALARVRAVVEGSLPFQQEARLGAVDEISAQLEGGLISPQQALWRAWERVEDERRLGRENSLHQQTITLGEERLLVDVAKLGMVMMYFRAPDGRVGALVRQQGRWVWQEERRDGYREQILALFDALSKQIRVGYFVLPNALPAERR